MPKPKRITRKRTKGWRQPPGTVYVGRPSRFGNPFRLIGDMIYCDASHRRKILSPWVLWDERLYNRKHGEQAVVFLYRHWLSGLYDTDDRVKPRGFTLDQARKELQGKNLSCWCSQDEPCHAAVLLDFVNSEDKP